MSEFIYTKEAAQRVGCCSATLLKNMFLGKLRGYKIGKSYGFKEDDLQQFIERKQVKIYGDI